MLFSIEWLKQLCPTTAPTPAIAELLTARGLTVDAVGTSPAGDVLDVDVPANRADCLGHLGLAREMAAALGCALAERRAPPAGLGPASSWVEVEIEDPDLCPRYTACLVRGVEVRPSPAWLVARLEACGLRSVNNVVDASNLVLLELGQPIHFFDDDRLQPPEGRLGIVVRRARAGERLTTLDGVERALDPEMLVIADRHRPLALAGVIGGADTEIRAGTRNVLIEAARFQPRSVRATARRLSAQTDASYRFERGVDADGQAAAQALAVALLGELAGGSPVDGMVDHHPGRRPPRELTLRPARLERLLGYRPETSAVLAALDALRLAPRSDGSPAITVTVPSWRHDLEREADLVEEVARHVGYDRIPTAAPALDGGEASAPETRGAGAADLLAGLGFHEAVGYSMVARDEDDPYVWPGTPPPLRLENPIGEQLACLRRSMLPGLYRALDLNLRRGRRDVRLFETGRVFVAGAQPGVPDEPRRLGLAWTGAGQPPHWSLPFRPVDLYDAMGLTERVLDSLSPGVALERRPGAPGAFHPGCSVHWLAGGEHRVAWGGMLHPRLQQHLDAAALLVEIDLDVLGGVARAPRQYVAVSRFPAVTRDLAVVLPDAVGYERLRQCLLAVDPPAAVRFEAIDRYQGPPLAENEASLTIRMTLEPEDRTLTDEETERFRQALVARLRGDLGLRVRA